MDKEVLKYMSEVKNYYLGKSKLNTEEVVNILLSSCKKENISEENIVCGPNRNTIFDMQELLKWKNKNNDKFEVSSHWAITSHRKFIGKFIIIGKKIVRKLLKWYVEPIIEQQNEFNGSITASINSLCNNEIVTENFINYIENKVENFQNEINKLKEEKNIAKELIQKNEKTENRILELSRKNEEAENRILELSRKNEKTENRILELVGKNEELENTLLNVVRENENLKSTLAEEFDYLNFKLYQLRNVHKNDTIVNSKIYEEKELKNDIYTTNSNYDLDYFEFENKFRGSRKNIKNRQVRYLKYFNDKDNILDIGCGRGEFLELLSDNGIKSEGIDLCKDSVDYCNYKGLPAKLENGLTYLKKIGDGSLGGVFMSQVAEHLKIEELIEISTRVYEKLEKGTYFIAETPNPTVLSTFTNSFYLDPSHKNPVHPETFKFILENIGFKEVEILFTEESKVPYKLPLLNGENIENLEEFNNGVNLLSELLFGSQDYAIIAKK